MNKFNQLRFEGRVTRVARRDRTGWDGMFYLTESARVLAHQPSIVMDWVQVSR